MKIKTFITKSVKKHDTQSEATIYIRLRDGRTVDYKASTELQINPNSWDEDGEQVKSKVSCSQEFRDKINNGVIDLKRFVTDEYNAIKKETLFPEWLTVTVVRFYDSKKKDAKEISNDSPIISEFTNEEDLTKNKVNDLYDRFLKEHTISEVRMKNNRVIGRILKRYELYKKATRKGQNNYALYFEDLTPKVIQDIWEYMANEHDIFKEHPGIFESIPEKRKPVQRGKNTLIDYCTRIKTFVHWVNDKKISSNDPFIEYKLDECVYGTPIYPTIEERNTLYEFDMSESPLLEQQRDVFVLQCMIGCRVGDYYRMTKSNVVNGAIEYVANKTSEETLQTIRVPLTNVAKEIISKYDDPTRESLMPFILEQDYNEQIKAAFKKAGLTRVVTVINTKTMKPKQSTLDKEASSHMARRTFVGNLFKKTKNQRLTSSMSGHSARSRAFERYSDIDDEMKQESIALIE